MFRTIQVHIAYEDEGCIYHLALKRSKSCKLYSGMWQIVTGSVEPNEHAYDTAVRELKEETGLVSDKWYKLPFLGGFYDMKRNSVESVPAFAVIYQSKPNIIVSEEHSEYKWVKNSDIENYMPIPDHVNGIMQLEKLMNNQEHLEIFRI